MLLNTRVVVRTLSRQPKYPTISSGLLVGCLKSVVTSRTQVFKCIHIGHLIILKNLTKKTKKMSKNTIRFLERKLRNAEDLLADSNWENHRLRRESYRFFEELEDLKEEHEVLKKKYEKLKHRIQEKNLTADFLEDFEGLSIAD